MSENREYWVGLPVAVRVLGGGVVEVEVDLSDAPDAMLMLWADEVDSGDSDLALAERDDVDADIAVVERCRVNAVARVEV